MDLEVKKAAGVDAGQAADEAELALIHRFSRKRLAADEVYLFTVRLCDNEVDRDGERFAPETLEALAQAFVGKSGIFDHQWSARGQTARIYRAEVVDEPARLTRAGDPYRYLKGWAYMLRTQANADLIAEIEGGIKKEVSVGCAVERTVCSICGGNMAAGDCGHIKGHEYDGKLCWGELTGLTDVYEWSFVAVPAQPEAGVLQKSKAAGVLRKALAGQDRPMEALEQLEREAGLGRRYLEELRKEVARLGGLAGTGLDAAALRPMVDRLEEPELLELKKAYQARVAQRFPVEVQLTYRGEYRNDERQDGAFLI